MRLVIACCSALAMSIPCHGFKKNLPFPERNASVETPTRNIHGMVLLGNSIFALPDPPTFLIKMPFRPGEATREARFGAFHESLHLNWPPELADAKPGALVAYGDDNLLLFDDQELSITQITTAPGFLVKRALIWDMIRPAADAKGEPTTVEVVKTRAQFKAAFQRSKTRLTGIAQIPDKWMGLKNEVAFLGSTEIPGFPLVVLTCLKENPTQCTIDRNCFLEGTFSKESRGIAVLPEQRSIFVGDASTHRILAYKFHSCFNVTANGEMILPAKIKGISNIFVDKDERLWVTSSAPDDYDNASIYMWNKNDWL